MRGEDGIILNNYSGDRVHSFSAKMGRENELDNEVDSDGGMDFGDELDEVRNQFAGIRGQFNERFQRERELIENENIEMEEFEDDDDIGDEDDEDTDEGDWEVQE